MQTPVLFLAFNRPQQSAVVLERIRQARPERLYVHIDGPRADKIGEAEKVAAVRALIDGGIDWPCTVQRLYRRENAGLRKGVFEALNWFFEQEAAGIVLEDDCVPDLSFFRFCTELLEKYAEEEQIMHIGGSNLCADALGAQSESYLFTRFSFVWGWASWRRAWQKMSLNMEDLDDFSRSDTLRQFLQDPMARTYMLDKFRVTQAGKNNSWAYAWFYNILKNNGLCIVAAKNLIQNTGIGDADAAHTRSGNARAGIAAQSLRFPLQHPATRQVDPQQEQRFFYSSQKSKFRLWLWFFLKQLGLR